MKKCYACKKLKHPFKFSIARRGKTRIYRLGKCKSCRNKWYSKRYWLDVEESRRKAKSTRNPEKVRNWMLQWHYGITLLQWREMFNKQGRKCAICKRKKPVGRGWNTDHKGKKVRGILCSHCNTLLGLAFESIKILKTAIRYIKRHA
jgi:Recombination endonuclease VII